METKEPVGVTPGVTHGQAEASEPETIQTDPHVASVHYRLEHDDGADFSRALALRTETAEFLVEIADGQATFTPKVHFASREAARTAIEPFLRSWEINTELQRGYRISFVYERSNLVNRANTPSHVVILPEGMAREMRMNTNVRTHIIEDHYPLPAEHFVASEDVAAMMDVYRSFKAGTFPLGSLGYRCLTHLEDSAGVQAGKRAAAAKKYRIEKRVLDTLGGLTSAKGGTAARKAVGSKVDYTAAERQWLDATVKALIRRAGEVASSPTEDLPEITMAGLPTIP